MSRGLFDAMLVVSNLFCVYLTSTVRACCSHQHACTPVYRWTLLPLLRVPRSEKSNHLRLLQASAVAVTLPLTCCCSFLPRSDKWLVPGGLIFPDRATLSLCAIEDQEYKRVGRCLGRLYFCFEAIAWM